MTNLTLFSAAMFQVDVNAPNKPYVNFDPQKLGPTADWPKVQMHFDPSSYGITRVSDYMMEFLIEVHGTGLFTLGGNVGPGTFNSGDYTLSGSVIVQLAMSNVPSQIIYGSVTQKSGPPWDWYYTAMRFRG